MRDFDQIYREYAPAVFRLSLRHVGRPEIAEEITSESFLALYRQMANIDQSQLPGWLFTVAKRRSMDYWRDRALEEKCSQPSSSEAVVSSGRVDVLLLLRRCSGLKPVHRACLMLRYVHGMSRAEISARTGLGETQVKGYLQHALKHLKREIMKGASSPHACKENEEI